MNFTGAAWNQLLTKGPLGATYNIFTPYIREGYHEAKCTLRVRYLPAGGAPVYSDMVHINLEGRKKSAAADAGSADYDSAANGPERPGRSADALAHGTASRKRPKFRGIGETILMPDERTTTSARRPAPAELTDEERARIIRDARARLKAETNGRIELVSHDESAPEATTVGKRPTTRPSWNALRDEARLNDENANDPGESASSEEPIAATPRRRGSRRGHVLKHDDRDSDEDEAGSPAEANEGDAVRRPHAHVLDDVE
jgi:hypothetical protein